MSFHVIYADPPWSYANKGTRAKADNHYATMTTGSIALLDVGSVASRDSTLHMWSTAPMIQEALLAMASWGFTYRTISFCWTKVYRNGKTFVGMGNYTRSNCEIVLLGTRGKGAPVECRGVRQVVTSTPGQHSEKPQEVADRILQLHGPCCDYLELFAREERAGWTCWGNEIDGVPVEERLSRGK